VSGSREELIVREWERDKGEGMRLVLLSNSTEHGRGYLDHAWAAVSALLGDVRELLFVPFALRDHEAYTAKVRARFLSPGISVRALPADASAPDIVEQAQAVFVGGGNTFRLLQGLQRTQALPVLRRRVLAGLPYLGASAGTNIAAPTIRTTNDMPIVEPAGFEALGLVPFQINPHYVDAPAGSTHMGETREQRLLEYLEENERAVLGLREGAWLTVENGRCQLEGPSGARLFRGGTPPAQLEGGTDLTFLM
jgi:dipeptidase E